MVMTIDDIERMFEQDSTIGDVMDHYVETSDAVTTLLYGEYGISSVMTLEEFRERLTEDTTLGEVFELVE